jgi:Peptidase family M28
MTHDRFKRGFTVKFNTFITAAFAVTIAVPTHSAAAQVMADSMFADSGVNATIHTLVSRLDLAKYKANIKGLTQFGDRRQGTDRNRAAVDWIEAQLKSYGCTDIGMIHYQYDRYQILPPDSIAARAARRGAGGQRGRGRGFTARGGSRPRPVFKGNRGPTGVNTDPMLQPDTAIRRIDMQTDTPGPREEIYCTKVGTTHPDEMYIVGGHMDGHGYGQAANDDGSGAALVMQLARVLSMPDVRTDVSIRFILWNNEETGLNGSKAYVEQRAALQGKEDPPGSGKYPEPKWLGMIQHDMMLFDHGMPGPDGKVSPVQRREADVNIEFAGTSKMAEGAEKLAWFFRAANDWFATDYPATVGDNMSNTDSDAFKDLVPSISLRENERTAQIGTGWDPQWHQPTDVYSTYSDKDFLLGLNAAQTTLAAVAELAGARVNP